MSLFGWVSRRKTTEKQPRAVRRAPLPTTIKQSDTSDAIARELLATIQEQGNGQPTGTRLSYEIPEKKMVVSPYEMSASLMALAEEYGLRFTSLALGVVNCTKI